MWWGFNVLEWWSSLFLGTIINDYLIFLLVFYRFSLWVWCFVVCPKVHLRFWMIDCCWLVEIMICFLVFWLVFMVYFELMKLFYFCFYFYCLFSFLIKIFIYVVFVVIVNWFFIFAFLIKLYFLIFFTRNLHRHMIIIRQYYQDYDLNHTINFP